MRYSHYPHHAYKETGNLPTQVPYLRSYSQPYSGNLGFKSTQVAWHRALNPVCQKTCGISQLEESLESTLLPKQILSFPFQLSLMPKIFLFWAKTVSKLARVVLSRASWNEFLFHIKSSPIFEKLKIVLIIAPHPLNRPMAGMGSWFSIYKYVPSHSCWLMKVLESPDIEVSQQISSLNPPASTWNHDAITKSYLKAIKSNVWSWFLKIQAIWKRISWNEKNLSHPF